MTGIFYNELFLEHETGSGHPECPDRLRAIMRKLESDPVAGSEMINRTTPASVDDLATVHERAYIDSIFTACEQAPYFLDADTRVSPRSCVSATLAAGMAIEAVKRVMEGKLANAFCAVRPPGHHAEKDRAMGFCLFNNIAIAARYLLSAYRLQRVLILDWDVHHGNGTQDAFYAEDQVYFISLHQWPLYPGSGRPDETGIGRGENHTLNVTFPPFTDRETYMVTFRQRVGEVLHAYRPEFILISAGFDAHRDDPLAQLMLIEEDFAEMTRFVLEHAAKLCSGRVVSLLEGGYDLNALANSVHAHLEALATAP